MKQTFTIPGRLEGLNEYIKAAHSPWKRSKLKQEQEAIVIQAAKAAGIKPMNPPVAVCVVYYEGKTAPREQVRDLDNVLGGGNKFILDALVELGVIPDDNTTNITKLSARGFKATGKPRIVVTLESEE